MPARPLLSLSCFAGALLFGTSPVAAGIMIYSPSIGATLQGRQAINVSGITTNAPNGSSGVTIVSLKVTWTDGVNFVITTPTPSTGPFNGNQYWFYSHPANEFSPGTVTWEATASAGSVATRTCTIQ